LGSFAKETYTRDAGLDVTRAKEWLRLVGSIKLQVSFAEYSLFSWALLQKRPIILSMLLTKATAYEQMCRDISNKMRDSRVSPFRRNVATHLLIWGGFG